MYVVKVSGLHPSVSSGVMARVWVNSAIIRVLTHFSWPLHLLTSGRRVVAEVCSPQEIEGCERSSEERACDEPWDLFENIVVES